MNSLEVEFLFRINFSLHVTPDLYFKYHSELVTHAVAADGSKVGVLVGGGEGTQRMPCMVRRPRRKLFDRTLPPFRPF